VPGKQFDQVFQRSDMGLRLGRAVATQLFKQGSRDKTSRSIRGWIRRTFATAPKPASEKKKEASEHEPNAGDHAEDEPKLRGFKQSVVSQADSMFYVAQYVIIVALLLMCWKGTGTKTNDSTVTLQLGTNSFAIAVQKTNIVVTNYDVQTLQTTNFIIKQAFTTNFIVITNVSGTNR